MPIYEYQCQACGERHDALQKFSEGPLRKCPACGRLKLKKLVSAAAFHLKGSGWYVTDFRDNGKGKPKDKDKGDGDGATTTASADDSKSDTKSDKKGDATSADKKADTKSESKTKDAAKPGSSASA